MKIQSLSIVVPTGKCWNHCKFCVSRMHQEEYGKNILSSSIPQAYLNRVKYVSEEGCNSMILTGTAEPQQNLPFIYELLEANSTFSKPFYNIQIQTTGSGLTQNDLQKLANLGLTTLALSINSFDDEKHWEICETPENKRVSIYSLINYAKELGLNIRACINLTSEFNGKSPKEFFDWALDQGIQQLTFRKIYEDGENEESSWIKEHQFNENEFEAIGDYIKNTGTPIVRLPFGFVQYSVSGISTVIDDNCMSKENIDELKYAILRPNGHLYSRWDDTGSLIF